MHPSTIAKEALRTHRSRHTSTPQPLSLSTDQVPDAAGYFITHARPVAQGARQAAPTTSTPTRWPVMQQTPGLLTRRPPFHHPFWPAQHVFHTHQGEQPTGGQPSCSPAAWPGTGAPYSGMRSPSTAAPPPPLIPEAAAHHSERQHHNQPRACPSGGSRADPPLLPQHIRPAFRTCRGQQPTEGHSNATTAWPWTGVPHRARVPCHRERAHRSDAWWRSGLGPQDTFTIRFIVQYVQAHHSLFTAF
jgi:hypothetical protein